MTRQIIKRATPGSALDINALAAYRTLSLSLLVSSRSVSRQVWSVGERICHGVATDAATRLLTCNSRGNKTGNCKRLWFVLLRCFVFACRIAFLLLQQLKQQQQQPQQSCSKCSLQFAFLLEMQGKLTILRFVCIQVVYIVPSIDLQTYKLHNEYAYIFILVKNFRVSMPSSSMSQGK